TVASGRGPFATSWRRTSGDSPAIISTTHTAPIERTKGAFVKMAFARRLAVPLLALTLAAGFVPTGNPEDLGLSAERLHRINDVVKQYIDTKQITGAVTMVARRGRVAHFEAQGLMNVEAKTPMRKDAIFRMASMTKPVAGVAILMLMEEGKLRLSDPVSRFIP